MVHNAVHHGFFNTLSLSIDTHPDIWTEINTYCQGYCKWYGIKTEDSYHEGKVHIHWVQIRDFLKFDPEPSTTISMYGPRRPHDNKKHIKDKCPLMTRHIADFGSKYSLQSLPLTSTQWIEYLNKESPMKINNLPDDPTLLQPYLSDHTERVGDPALAADAAKYQHFADLVPTPGWIRTPPTAQSCRRFYRFCMFHEKTKRVCIDENTIKKRGASRARYMTQSVYSDADGHAICFPGNPFPCHPDCLECNQ